ncbi:FHA domain-containing protein [Halobacteriovorax sp. GB3]|uniref:FHA domain-containing protein n=1 Tax=Halobacteriovorax sp. GB3 TaxID=2719615 RepID=UPI002360BAE9|nr:FHA domain-containing protein [Halobacteriovorax sp. GB3]MDD0853318.1 FHA domain-containing protein [Halobacteriovorax sp. GB3]
MNSEHYVLEIRLPGQAPVRYEIEKKIALGSDARCKIHLRDFALSPIHCLFLNKQGVLTIQCGSDNPTIYLEKTALEKGKKYALDSGDKIKIDKIDIIVRIEEEEELPDSTLVRNLFPEELQQLKEESIDRPIVDDEHDQLEEQSESSSAFTDENEFDETDELPRNLSEEDEEDEIPVKAQRTGPTKATSTGANLLKKAEKEVEDRLSEPSIQHDSIDDQDDDEDYSSSTSFFESVTSIIHKALKKDPKSKKKKKSEEPAKPLGLKNSKIPSKARLKNMKTRDVPKLEKSNKKPKVAEEVLENAEVTNELDIVGFIPRLLSILANFSLTHLMIGELGLKIDQSTMKELVKTSRGALSSLGFEDLLPQVFYNTLSTKVLSEGVLQFIIIYFALELLWSLLFGISLPLTFFGAKTNGSGVSKRIKAFFRTFLGMFTFFFVIFDLPAIIKKKTVKELVSVAPISFSNLLFKYLGFVPAILVIFLPLEIPFLLNNGMNSKPAKIRNFKMVPRSELPNRLEILDLTSAFELDQYEVFPRVGRSLQTTAGLDFYRKNSLKRAGIKKKNSLAVLNTINNFKDGNFFFSLTSPNLSEAIDQNSSSKVSDREIEEIIYSAFNISIDSLIDVILSQGPELKRLYELKSSILQLIGVFSDYELEVFQAKGFKVFSFYIKQESQYSVFFVRNNKIENYTLDYSINPEHALLLAEHLFANAELYANKALKTVQITPFKLSHLVSLYKEKQEEPTSEELQLFVEFYKDKMKSIEFAKEPTRKQKIVKGHLKELISLFQELFSEGEVINSPEFQELQGLLALE